MFKLIKILLVLSLGLAATFILINQVDMEPNKNLKKQQNLQANHKITEIHISLETLIKRIDTKDEIKGLQTNLTAPFFDCFIKSTCSNKNYNLAVEKTSALLNQYKPLLAHFQRELSEGVAITVPPQEGSKENFYHNLDSLIKLQLAEINFLYSKINDDRAQADRATEKALILNTFIISSLNLPNTNTTAIFLTARLLWLRSSLQKYSPSRIELPIVDSFKIIENVKTGDFINFSNNLDAVLKSPTTDLLQPKFHIPLPTFLISKTSTLNLYTDLSEKYARADCVRSLNRVPCAETVVEPLHPINPVGRVLARKSTTPSKMYKKIVFLTHHLNALNL